MNKRSRIKLTGAEAVYHCISRVVWSQQVWGDREKEVMRKQLWRVAEFSGVQILTYCIMSNHFHILVRVPDGKNITLSDDELLRRYKLLYPRPTRYERARIEVISDALKANGSRAETLRKRLLARMHDISEFMKTFKQRYTLWYNRTHDCHGTHWSERFTSLLVQNTPQATATVAAYIDLNPVRAGIVEDPKDYRWCGYAEALAHQPKARQGIARAVGTRHHPAPGSPQSTGEAHGTPIPPDAIREALARYRIMLFGKGSAPAPGKTNAATIPLDKTREVMQQEGKVPIHTLLRSRLRHLSRGLILGTEDFIQTHIADRLRRGEIRRHHKPVPLPPTQENNTPLSIAKNLHKAK